MEKMETLRNAAEAYTPPVTKNITELGRVPVDVEIKDESFTKEDGEEFTIKKISINDTDYRVPVTVLKQLKEILKEMPELKFFKVNKTGEGMKTTYTTIPLLDKE